MPRDSPWACLIQPGGEEPFDIPATARPFQTTGDRLAFHDDESRHCLDLEVRQQIRPLLLRHTHDLECPVIAAALEHLREETLDPPAMPGQARMEEDKPRRLESC